ncbi:MAG: nucleotidyl transferase AbiEii/AbiGii toxin family protein [Propionibacteriaceae bacterium]|jgi:hypothetical protein|nr:nucleotidyl transferase AbiEii/AbiGii toxin family protein [Propionibacteriaceae bacterium]
MKPYHERLARIALSVIADRGFVLAGGYAISQNGMGERPSMDVDLFTDRNSPESFSIALAEVRQTFQNHGLNVEVVTEVPMFANLQVSDTATGETSELQLCYDYRYFPPVLLSIGPVLAPDDAVKNKMSALWSRGYVRDFIDIDAVLRSGMYTRREVLALGDTAEALPFDKKWLAARFRTITEFNEEAFAQYGVTAAQREEIIKLFLQWADEIDPCGRATLAQ